MKSSANLLGRSDVIVASLVTGIFIGFTIGEASKPSSPPPPTNFTTGAFAGINWVLRYIRSTNWKEFPSREELAKAIWDDFLSRNAFVPADDHEEMIYQCVRAAEEQKWNDQFYQCAFDAAVRQCEEGGILRGPIIVPCGGTVSNMTVTLVHGECAFHVTGTAHATISDNMIWNVQ